MHSTQHAAIGAASPFFIVADVPRAAAHYQERFGFEVRFLSGGDSPFFAIVGRGQAQFLLKAVDPGVLSIPNHTRHKDAPWDAFVYAADPQSLLSEFEAREVHPRTPLHRRDDGLLGFEVADHDGYVLFFGCPDPNQ